jgi:UPF0755 protein
MRAKARLTLLGACAALLVAAAAGGALGWRFLHSSMKVDPEGDWLEVPAGVPLMHVSEELARRGLLEHPRVLSLYARLRGEATRIHAGEYRIAHGTTPDELLTQLVEGRVYLHQLTVVEGWRVTELFAALRAEPAIRLTGIEPDQIMAALGESGVAPEGEFFPDTYRFPKGTTDLEFLRQAHEALQQHLEEAWKNRQPGIVLETPYEALILASIIEKETALPSERRKISGVFHRRLERGMRLQTDPTVIYGLGEAFDGNLRRDDLARDTPYNTYTRAGLPPTPIALPSAASLEAAVSPDIGDALYFVATGRPDGSHYFSATLEEHNRAVASYLSTLRKAHGD